MKTRIKVMGAGLALLWAGLLAVSAQEWTRYTARPGSGTKLTIEGTSTIHAWSVETGLVGGFLEIGPEFPIDPAKSAAPGKVQAKAQSAIFVSSIKSGKKSMDEVMYDTMKQKVNPRISYQLNELVLKEPPKAGQPMIFDSTGTITVAGITTTNSFPITMEPKEGGEKIVVKGKAQLKMTDFGMKPPAPSIGLGLIKTGDEVTVSFEWITSKTK